MLTKPAILAINFYQKHISPHKGYCCAYKVYHNDASCSAYVKETIKNDGVFNSLSKIKERFQECKKASEYIQNEYKDIKKEEKEIKPGKCEECGRCGTDACSVASCFGIIMN